MREMMAQAAAVLPASMQVPASATTGTPFVVERGVVVELAHADARGHADALAEIGEVQHRAEHAAVEGPALVGIHRVADAEHAAHVQHLDDVARGEHFGRWPE